MKNSTDILFKIFELLLKMNSYTKIIMEPAVFGLLFLFSITIIGFNQLATVKKLSHSLDIVRRRFK